MAEPKRRQLDPRTPLPSETIPPPLPRRALPVLEPAPPWLAPRRSRDQIDTLWLLVASILTVAALFFFGWRALLSIAVVVAAALAGYALCGLAIRWLRPAHPMDSLRHVAALAMLLALAMPVTHQPAVVILAGLILGFAAHFVGRIHRMRIHPVALALVIIWITPPIIGRFSARMEPPPVHEPVSAVLRPQRVIFGNVRDHEGRISRKTWTNIDPDFTGDAVLRHEPYSLLVRDQKKILQPPSILVNMLTSGELARVEELLFGSVPGPVGSTSRGLIILLGLYLIYRRLATWPMTLAAFAAGLVTLLLMPVASPDETTTVLTRITQLQPAIAVTYLGYMLLASPLLMFVFILAPITAPMTARGRVVYGAILGSSLIITQWILQNPQAAPLSLLVASALARPLDALRLSHFVRTLALPTPVPDDSETDQAGPERSAGPGQ